MVSSGSYMADFGLAEDVRGASSETAFFRAASKDSGAGGLEFFRGKKREIRPTIMGVAAVACNCGGRT